MSERRYKVIIAGGGTGGHLFPGIAVAEEFKRRHPDINILFAGTERGIESKVLPREGYNVEFFKTQGFVRNSMYKKIKAIFIFFISFFNTYFFLRRERPDIIVGTGGYVSFLPVMVSKFMNIPSMILEQNTLPGLSNRILSRIVKKVCVTYEASLKYFPKNKTILTGNPVRDKVLRGGREKGVELFSLKEGRLTVFIFGGSSGAKSINKALQNALEFMLDIKDHIQFLHQTGEDDYGSVRSSYIAHGYSGTVAPFIYQMAEAYAVADVIVSRAGATTITEITAIGIPSILIPYPYAASSHQEINASRLESNGAAIIIDENHLNGETLAGNIREMVLNESLRNKLRIECMAMGKTDAAKKVVDIALSIIKN